MDRYVAALVHGLRTFGKEMTSMKRYVVVLTVLTWLALPLVAAADDQTVPPEANWSATPPARTQVDAGQLMELLVRKGMLTPIDQSGLTQPPVAAPANNLREMDRQHGNAHATAP
jgi:hypothetical protein